MEVVKAAVFSFFSLAADFTIATRAVMVVSKLYVIGIAFKFYLDLSSSFSLTSYLSTYSI